MFTWCNCDNDTKSLFVTINKSQSQLHYVDTALKGHFTHVVYYAIVIAITIRFKNGLCTIFAFVIVIPIHPIEKNRNRLINRKCT